MSTSPTRPRRRSATEPRLFNDEKRAEDTVPRLVMSSSFAVGPLLSRGCLTAVDEGQPIQIDGARLGLVVHDGAFPATVVTSVEQSGRNVSPIGIRLKPGRAPRHISLDENVQAEALSLLDVDSLVFRSEKELVRFSALEFNNYSFEAVRVGAAVSGDVFQSPSAAAPLGFAPEQSVRTAERVRHADCRSGLLAYLLCGGPGVRPWMNGVASILGRKEGIADGESWPARVVVALTSRFEAPVGVDDALLAAAFHAAIGHPVEAGWPADDVRKEIVEHAAARVQGEKAVQDLKVWSDRTADVLAARAEPTSLSDDAHIVQRAVLLFLLRGDLDALGDGMKRAAQKPGPLVTAVAGSLMAFRTGLRALPSRFKMPVDGGPDARLIRYLSEAYLRLISDAQRSLVPSGLPTPSVTYRSSRALQGDWVVTIEGNEVSRKAAEFDTGLERLLSMGRDLGFEFEEEGDGLRTALAPADGRQRLVSLRVLKTRDRAPFVRFCSPVLKVSGVGARKLSKDFLLELLSQNADPDMNCRFGIEDGGTVVVLADQLLGTLDEAEFKRHLEHVAETAERFELSRAGGQPVPTVS